MKFIFEIVLDDSRLIGRLRSGLFDIVDGHVYFNNNVIKIRYDLIKSNKNYTQD